MTWLTFSEESFLYPNASLINSTIVEHVKAKTRRGRDYTNVPLGDRPWNDPGPKRGQAEKEFKVEQSKPLCRAVVLDFAAVANLDTTGVQNLVDTRKEVEKWADAPVEFHFSGILSPWVRRALIAGGFGQGIRESHCNSNADVSSPWNRTGSRPRRTRRQCTFCRRSTPARPRARSIPFPRNPPKTVVRKGSRRVFWNGFWFRHSRSKSRYRCSQHALDRIE